MFDNNQSELLTPDSSNQPNPLNPVNPLNQQLVDQMLMNPMTFSRLQELMRQRQKLLLLQQQIDALKDVEPGKNKYFWNGSHANSGSGYFIVKTWLYMSMNVVCAWNITLIP